MTKHPETQWLLDCLLIENVFNKYFDDNQCHSIGNIIFDQTYCFQLKVRETDFPHFI